MWGVILAVREECFVVALLELDVAHAAEIDRGGDEFLCYFNIAFMIAPNFGN